jgi:hypothetical protein
MQRGRSVQDCSYTNGSTWRLAKNNNNEEVAGKIMFFNISISIVNTIGPGSPSVGIN